MLQDGQKLSCQEVYDRLLKKVQHIDDTIAKLQALKAHLAPLLDRCQQNLEQPQEGQQCVVFQQNSLATPAEPPREPIPSAR
jgi:MerR family transcriptional regulator, Zn(II)-responsive regulator of zntA